MKTNIVFKIIDGDVLALFPDEKWDNRGNISSYMRIGQHGGASRFLLKELKDASPEEYEPLLDELTSIGYDLNVLN